MKDTIIKINELIYPDIPKEILKAFESDKITLEDVLLALDNIGKYFTINHKDNKIVIEHIGNPIIWQLTKTLTQQSETTQQTIKQIFEDGK